MSLDKIIREKADEELTQLRDDAGAALAIVSQGTPVSAVQLGRLVSGHKVKTTWDACVKMLADNKAAEMLASLEGEKSADQD